MDRLSTIILGLSLIAIMLGMGLSLAVSDFMRLYAQPKAIFVGLCNQLLILPLIGLLIAISLSLPAEIAVGLMILAACPGGPTSNLISYLAKADLALSVSLTFISSLITIITIPFIVNFSLEYFVKQGTYIRLDIVKTVAQIFIVIVIPIAAGMTLRKFRSQLADRMEKPLKIASGLVLVLIVIGLIVKEKENVIDYFEQAGIATLVLNIGSMLVGYLSAKLFNLRDKQAASIAIESGIQNGTLAISIAVVLLSNTTFAIAPAIYSLIMFVSGAGVVFLRKDKKISY